MRPILAALALALFAGCGQSLVRFDAGQPSDCSAVGCPSGKVCMNGACVSPPDSGRPDAGGADAGCASDAGLGSDLDNCGQCGRRCPVPLNAPPACEQGKCGRGSCNPGFFDFDPGVFGCETACVLNTCTRPDGGTVVLTNPPVLESGARWQTTSSGAAYGQAIQTNPTHTNHGTVGQPTPGGTFEQTNATHKNVGGFESMLRK